MSFSEASQLMRYEHYQDLLREAEQERLLRAAFPRSRNLRALRRVAARVLRDAGGLALRVSDALNPQVESRTDYDVVGLR